MSKRFKLNQPILTIGVSLKEKLGTKPYPSLTAILFHCALNNIAIDNIEFTLREITPIEKYPIPNASIDDNVTMGYIGISSTPILKGVDLKFTNHYPHSNYNRHLTPSQDNHIWTVLGDSNIDWCKMIINAKVPYRYEVLQHALLDIANIESARFLIIRIFKAIEENWPQYEIKKKEFLNSGIYFFKINHIPH